MTIASRPRLADFAPLSHDYFEDPHSVWARARDQAPVFFDDATGAWFISRYEDVTRALSDWETFSSEGAVTLSPAPASLEGRVPPWFFSEPFIGIDPPRHTVARKAANRGFTRGRVAEQEAPIRELANRLVDEFAGDGRCDLVEQFAFPLTINTIARILGLPADDVELLKAAAADAGTQIAPKGVTLAPTPDAHERWTAIADAFDCLVGHITARRDEPTDDLISAMIHATGEDGRPILTHERMVTHLFELVAAGTDTTAGLVATMVQLLAAHPDQLAEVLTDPALWPNAIEEGLRVRGSSWGIFRRTTREVEMAGTTLPEGALVYLSYISASNDERHFVEPERFDIHRANASDHLAFGKGRHFCPGSTLARLESRIALETLYTRLPELAPVSEQPREYHASISVPLLAHLDVEFQKTARSPT
jgi:cytochrome P450